MQLRLIIPLFCLGVSLLGFAMSQNQKATFKQSLKGAQTSQEMEQLVQAKLPKGQRLILTIDTLAHVPYHKAIDAPSFQIEIDDDSHVTDLSRAVKNAVKETFFEEMHPYIYKNAPIDQELAKFKRYGWAANDAGLFEERLRAIFGLKGVTSTIPENNELFRQVKNQVAEVCGENNLLYGNNDFPERFKSFAHKNPGFGIKIAKYVGGGLLAVVAVCGVYYWYTAKTEEQDDEAEQESARDNEIA